MRSIVAVLLLTFAASSQTTTPEPKVEDNSFLMEEAYNQEFGVVQHIQSFTRNFETKDYVYSFTQEWPIDLDPRHQFSYTLQGVKASDLPNSGFGIGDTLLNYRFQLVDNARVAVTPRASLLIPSGDSAKGRGAGGAGFQTNWALSFRAHKKLTMHSNAGWTVIPNAKNLAGDKARSDSFNLGQSFIWLAKPRFNVLLETVYQANGDVTAPGKSERSHDVTMNPGVRWAYNLQNGMQIVPGVSVPVGIGPSSGQTGILFYLSVEHAFRRKKG
jgi:hypothetical protein